MQFIKNNAAVKLLAARVNDEFYFLMIFSCRKCTKIFGISFAKLCMLSFSITSSKCLMNNPEIIAKLTTFYGVNNSK